MQVQPAAVATDELWALLMRFSFDHVLRHFVRVVAEFDLSPPQAHLLLHLSDGHGLSQRDHARQLGCDPSNLTGLSDRLEARGLIERRVDPEDRRVKMLVATPKGEQLRAQLAARLAEAPAAITQISARDRALLHQLLRQIIGY